ncbi:hypothetical protein TNCV_4232971 [Trichonephila clavipes]|nr:hypothetical protein TNCV_4232971 [Trichonephila clavipes]
MFKTIVNPTDDKVRSVEHFLNTRNVNPGEAHRRLVEIYSENVMGDRMMRKWSRKNIFVFIQRRLTYLEHKLAMCFKEPFLRALLFPVCNLVVNSPSPLEDLMEKTDDIEKKLVELLFF